MKHKYDVPVYIYDPRGRRVVKHSCNLDVDPSRPGRVAHHIQSQARALSLSDALCRDSVYLPPMGNRLRTFIRRAVNLQFRDEESSHRCPQCQRYFITGKRGVQVHLQSRSNKDCFEWYHSRSQRTPSTSSFETSSNPTSDSSDSPPPDSNEDSHDEAPNAPLHADGYDTFDFDNLPSMIFSEEELHPRAEPRIHDNHSVKHSTAGSAFGPPGSPCSKISV